MANQVETTSYNTDANYIKSKQQLMPSYLKGTFVIDDTDDHDFEVDARGKSKMSVVVENPGDQTLTVQVWGLHKSGDVAPTTGTVQIGSDWTVTDADDRGYRTVADPFPFYVIRVTPAAGATGNPTCTVYVNLTS